MNKFTNKLINSFKKDFENDELSTREIVFTTIALSIGILLTIWYLYITCKVAFVQEYSWMDYVREYVITTVIGTITSFVTYVFGGFTGSLKLGIKIAKKIWM